MTVQKRHDWVGTTPADAASLAGRAKPITLRFDRSVFYPPEVNFGPADKLVFKTGRDNATPVDNIFSIFLNDQDFAGNTPYMTINARGLGDVIDDGGPLYMEYAVISTAAVTGYNVLFLGSKGDDFFESGIGSDTVKMGDGNDHVVLGLGDDAVSLGTGDDRIDSFDGGIDANDMLNGGAGTDQLQVYAQDLTDADLANVRSIEILGSSGDGSIELDANAMHAGIREIMLDSGVAPTITVGANFTGPLLVNYFSAYVDGLTFDASRSSATVTFDASYDTTLRSISLIGGKGADDTIIVSNGFVFPGSPEHGGDLSHVTGFEHVIVADLADSGAFLALGTKAGDIAAAFQTIDASALGEGKAFDLRGGGASADLHVVSGASDDLLVTGRGDDVIAGGLGGDTMSGGAGKDVFAYHAVADSSGDVIDAILDFTSGKDTIDVTGLGADLPSLSGATIAFLGNAGDDRVLRGTAGDGVLDVLYRTDTHTLWFDTNDDGKLDASDLHIAMGATATLTGADVLAGHVLV